jgi:hypothetical protein
MGCGLFDVAVRYRGATGNDDRFDNLAVDTRPIDLAKRDPESVIDRARFDSTRSGEDSRRLEFAHRR